MSTETKDTRTSLGDQLRELVQTRAGLVEQIRGIDHELDEARSLLMEIAEQAVAPSKPSGPQPIIDAQEETPPADPAPASLQSGALIERKSGRKPTRTDAEFALWVQQHPGCSAAELMNGLVATSSITKRKLQTLQKAGLVHVVGRTVHAKWFPGPKRGMEPDPEYVTAWRGGEGLSSSMGRKGSQMG